MPLAFYMYRDEPKRASLESIFPQTWHSEVEYGKWLISFANVEKTLLYLHEVFVFAFERAWALLRGFFIMRELCRPVSGK